LQAVSEENLATIEHTSKQWIAQAQDVSAAVVSLAAAKTAGAMMLFGEKYPDPVRMISIGNFSKELCGGTHLANSSDIEDFEIVAEESVSSGTRRIEALTGNKARRNQKSVIEAVSRLCLLFGVGESQLAQSFDQQFQSNKELKKQLAAGQKNSTEFVPVVGGDELDYFNKRKVIRSIARALNEGVESVVDRVQSMIDESSRLEQQLSELDSVEQIDAAGLLGLAESLNGIDVIVCELLRSNSNLMRQLIDQIRKKRNPVAIFLATVMPDEKVLLVAGVSRVLVDRGIKAGDWVKEIAPIVGGGGGGKPELAQAGGNQPQNISKSLQAARNFFAATVIQ
jgi:alanyl-tRNA synthetase